MGLFPGSLKLCGDLIVIPRLRSSGFVICYDVTMIRRRMEPKMVHGREGTKRCPVLYGSEIWAILCVIVGKINNMLFVKIMLIYKNPITASYPTQPNWQIRTRSGEMQSSLSFPIQIQKKKISIQM